MRLNSIGTLIWLFLCSVRIAAGQDSPNTEKALSIPEQSGRNEQALIAEQDSPDNEKALSEKAKDKVQEIGSKLDESKTAQEISAGILNPIYKLTEYLSHPWFYWIAFAVMAAGVVSFAGQLVLTKLLLLMQMKLNFKEILSDLLGLIISVTGLVLTTQAATENSTFPSSPAAVLSSAVVGAIAGIMFYLWGQGQEFRAARGNRPAPPPPPEKRKM